MASGKNPGTKPQNDTKYYSTLERHFSDMDADMLVQGGL